jgi:DNA-binding CsgD family transcriptional regulator
MFGRFSSPSLLKTFQQKNCRKCYFGKLENIGTPKSCCSYPGIPRISEDLTSCSSQAPRLTPRQIEILILIRDGLNNKEIAARLQLSPQTVKNHIERILSQLVAYNRTEAVVTAVRKRIISIEENGHGT